MRSLGIALVAVLAMTAHAAAERGAPLASSRASIYDYKVDLTDLEPADGKVAALQYVPGSIDGTYYARLNITKPQAYLDPADLLFTDGLSTDRVLVSADSVVVTTENHDAQAPWWQSQAVTFAAFELSPNTEMVVSGRLSVQTRCMDCLFSNATVDVGVGWGNDGVFYTAYLTSFNNEQVPDVPFEFPVVNDTDAPMPVWLGFNAYTQTSAVSAVPEPMTWLLMSTGIAFAALRRRIGRRARKTS
ncbi:PEP-CTERM sorting domain-containing protein [Rubrivivax gelatinosus]|uniref:PEP-CTERM protein-sorting domain-containing protein n=1 Tax=Rubrivivax gelatinosus (strain NBRC 100245 / IL144) TaxID=983917 RepID=I0HQG7_RUBGI|nr:PEP-CTERM sorting domain-containing protein [Rubrivivax gelatinosus]BAL95254.1 hypothetical protein RGE_19130 [Rubrivivax gelatinosus IL144]